MLAVLAHRVLSVVSIGGWRNVEVLGVAVTCKKQLGYQRNCSASLINSWSEGRLWVSLAVASSQVTSPWRRTVKGQ